MSDTVLNYENDWKHNLICLVLICIVVWIKHPSIHSNTAYPVQSTRGIKRFPACTLFLLWGRVYPRHAARLPLVIHNTTQCIIRPFNVSMHAPTSVDVDKNINTPWLLSQHGKHSQTCEMMRPHYCLLWESDCTLMRGEVRGKGGAKWPSTII